MTTRRNPWRPERLRAAVDRSGRSKRWIAERIGVSRQTIHAWMNGTATPNAPDLAALVLLVDTTLEHVLYMDETQSQ